MPAAQAPPAAPTTVPPLTFKDFKGKDPIWCPGCGDFGVLTAMQKAAANLALDPNRTVLATGIGCSGNITAYFRTFGIHGIHGRVLPLATGVKATNPDLTVLAAGGDGDGFGIGLSHFLHAARRNVDLTYIVMDNQVYGLTTGQVSPTSIKGMKTKSTPYGSVENAINPIPLAIVAGATYVARGFSGKQKHLVEIIKGGIQHKGFSFIDVFSPCVTYNKDNTYQFFNSRVKLLEEAGHDPSDFAKAMERGYQWGEEIPVGVFWKRTDLPSLEELEPVLDQGGPLAFRKLGISDEQAQALIDELL